MEEYITVFDGQCGEYTEKRSKFIAKVYHIESAEEGATVLNSVKTKYFDARHNVYAYILRDGTMRFSDDGEPHGTAGKPILDIISGSGVVDIMITVTRYFGGVLLGTGGLVRAYSTSAGDALKNSKKVLMCRGRQYSITIDYSSHRMLLSVIEKSGGTVADTVFGQDITVFVDIKTELSGRFEDLICETFSAKYKPKVEKEKIFPFEL